jgi:hypothetical protein
MTAPTPEDFFADHPLGLAALERVLHVLNDFGPVEVRISKSQVAFRRRRGFAYLWLPGQYLRKPTADVVLSIALGRHDTSPRFKEVAHPSATQWIHHLEVHDVNDVDDEVEGWLREAADRAS